MLPVLTLVQNLLGCVSKTKCVWWEGRGLTALLFAYGWSTRNMAGKWERVYEEVNLLRLNSAINAIHAVVGNEHILIKGEAASRFYPTERTRYYSDFDFVLSDVVAEKLTPDDLLQIKSVGIDLHIGLRHLDTLSWTDLYDRCEQVNDYLHPVFFPCPEDHLRITAVHWLTDGGEFKERLWDIYYAVANRPADFDWNKCLDVVSPTRRKWVITTIGLAHKYLGLEIEDLPFAEEAKDIPNWIIRTVEREWAREVRLIPLRIAYRKPRMFIEQIRKRLPPNPITATIDMEGEFDDRPRIWYQLGSIAKRIPPSIRRFVDLAKARLRQ